MVVAGKFLTIAAMLGTAVALTVLQQISTLLPLSVALRYYRALRLQMWDTPSSSGQKE